MNKLEITIDNKTYPCRLTMGAYLRYKRETGKDVSEDINGNGNLSDTAITTLMWCAIAAASKHDNREFDLSLEEFADSIDLATASRWYVLATKEQADKISETAEEIADEKKS